MPIALALAIRSIIQLATTLAVYTTAEAFIRAALPLIEKLLAKIFGFTEQEARDFLHDWMIDQAVSFGLTVVALRKQMPTIVAERLGFTSKGFAKMGLSAGVKTKIEQVTKTKLPDNLTKGWGAWSPVMKIMSVITAVFMMTQSIEVFAYRPRFFTNILDFVGLGKVAERILIPAPAQLFSDVEVKSYATGLHLTEEEMRHYLNTASDVIRSRAKVPTQSNVLKVIREYLLPTAQAGTAAIPTPQTPAGTLVKIFTGLISQSAFAAALPFVPRQDDLIENVAELRTAIQNNEAPFLASLPGRIIREVKIVSTVTTKDGITRRGASQQVISSYLKDGTPRYKTVVNKFAVADIYIMTEKLVRTKIQRIIYGPVDSAIFRPKENELAAMNSEIQSSAKSAEAALTQTLLSLPTAGAAPAALMGMPAAPQAAPLLLPKIQIVPREYYTQPDAPYGQIYYASDNQIVASPDLANILTEDERRSLGNRAAQWSAAWSRLAAAGYPVDTFKRKQFWMEIDGKTAPFIQTNSLEEFFGTTVTVEPAMAGQTLLPAAAGATTLWEFYNAQNKPLPSITERGLLYEALGLGKAAFYTGTAEQNLKLLTKLQGKA